MTDAKQALVNRIWDRVKQGESVHDATVAVHAEIARSRKDLASLWDTLGLYWLKETERDARRIGPEPLQVEPATTAGVRAWTPPKNYGTSWRDRVDPLAILVSVGCSGVQKAAGDLTREDVKVCADFHGETARTAAERERQWLAIHGTMKEHETVRQTALRVPSLLDGAIPWVKRSQKEEKPEAAIAAD